MHIFYTDARDRAQYILPAFINATTFSTIKISKAASKKIYEPAICIMYVLSIANGIRKYENTIYYFIQKEPVRLNEISPHK